MAEAVLIIATLFVILHFPKKQMQSIFADLETKALNNLDKKINGHIPMIIEQHQLIKVVGKLEKILHQVRNLVTIFSTPLLTHFICIKET